MYVIGPGLELMPCGASVVTVKLPAPSLTMLLILTGFATVLVATTPSRIIAPEASGITGRESGPTV